MPSVLVPMGAELKHPDLDADPGRVAHSRPTGIGEVAFDDLCRAALSHEPWACRQLYDDYAARVLGYLRAQGAREPEDLTSEVFLREPVEHHFRSWLFTIAHRILIDDVRRRQRRPQTTMLGADVE